MTTQTLAAIEPVATTGNRLLNATIQPIVAPLWLGAEKPGVELAAAALESALRRRWKAGQRTELLARLDPPVAVPVEAPADALERLHRRTLEFLPEVAAACERVAGAVADAIEGNALALTLGGDHALSVGSIAGAARAAARAAPPAVGRADGGPGRVGVLWFDTHADLNTPDTSPSGHLHGMALAAALGWGGFALAEVGGPGPKVRPDDICLLGLRDLDPAEREILEAGVVWALTMEEWTDAGILPGVEAALTHLAARGVAAVHVSFDLDVLDPCVLPGTGTRYPGGLTFREAAQVLRRLRDWDGPVHSVDWVELNPSLDPGGASAATATALLATLLGETMR